MFIDALGIIILYWVPELLEKANHIQCPSYQSKWFGWLHIQAMILGLAASQCDIINFQIDQS